MPTVADVLSRMGSGEMTGVSGLIQEAVFVIPALLKMAFLQQEAGIPEGLWKLMVFITTATWVNGVILMVKSVIAVPRKMVSPISSS